MFANYLIGLREGLEAALVVGILLSYIKRLDRPGLASRIWIGVGIAIAISLGLGAILTFGTYGLSFGAKEAIGGGLSIIATGFVTWMVFWMLRTSQNMRGTLHGEIDRAVAASAWSLVIVAFFAVGREGIETALFIWAAVQSVGSNSLPLVGAALGIATAVVLGYVIYRGMVKVNLAKFFAWSGAFLIVLAAGVLSYGIHDLQEGGILPGLHDLAFDVSSVIPPDSWYGTLLKGTVNFSPATTWLELTVWLLYFVPTMFFFLRTVRRNSRARAVARSSAPEKVAA
ncbi:high-affinity Fe2+/Pb2+ permease (plasmid) [Cnuibacter physcomitrellae]|uniref:High-affinity Fe2+/Pb2+ permease n=1 Tax=Cnuibacter physcomitrellae TaxID=1619308 RepID=A0A1X9LUA8_9MICO|nr:iron uptake transporter permease EfeU [Cnuibacter physcomitrellae]ARJ07591.1 high-affinity Fe2+/Pb2+ permease [Cnuibacter physcomitrellae]